MNIFVQKLEKILQIYYRCDILRVLLINIIFQKFIRKATSCGMAADNYAPTVRSTSTFPTVMMLLLIKNLRVMSQKGAYPYALRDGLQ